MALRAFRAGAIPPKRCRQAFARSMRLRQPDIQKQLLYHMRAREAALRGLKLSEAGKLKEARKAQQDAERNYKIYVEYGGRGPLT